uniref:Uncharacterized protein n=1 Tax=Oryza brachyantha TaxID=4533 RepID=J3KVW1_ORYBR
MLLFLIGDDPEKKPYSKASKALFSDIEHGCLPQVILGDMPCKFIDGTVVCEVRDYRPFLSNAGDSSGDDFPIVKRISLRLGTECVVKDLASIVNASWTYHDQLIAEATILRALQPRLNLDPTPCLERLQNSVVKKIDLGINKGRQQTKATSIVNISADPPENCKPKEFITCEGAVVYIENEAPLNEAPEGLPCEILDNLSMNCPYSLQIEKAKSAAGSDPDNATQYSSTFMNRPALYDRKQSSSGTPAPDLLLQSQEQPVQGAVLPVDHEYGRVQKETVLPQNRKENSNLRCEVQEHQNCGPSNKYSRLSSENSKCHFQMSMRTANNKGLNLVSPNEQTVRFKLDQTTGSKDMTIQQQKALSAFTATHPSLDTNNLCAEKIPEEVNSSSIRLTDRNMASTVGPDNYFVSQLKDRRAPFVTSCSASSRKAPSKPPKFATEPRPTSSKRKVLEVSTSLNQEPDSEGKRQKKACNQSSTLCENRSSVEQDFIGGVSSQLGISPDIESCIEDPSYTIEPDIEKILSEAILTSQRHGLNGKAAKIEGPERTWPLPPSNFFPTESAAEIAYTQNETMSYYQTGRTMDARKIRKLSFHPVQYFCRGVVDECHYTLCLLSSEALDDHQIAVETIYGDERIYISTVPTSHHANKLVDQFISLMKRDGYTLCNDIREQTEIAPQLGSLTGEYPQYPWRSSPIARNVAINGNNNIGYTFHNGSPYVHANGQQQWMQAQQCATLASFPTYFWNPYHPGHQRYTNTILDQGRSFPNGMFSMNLNQYQPVQQRQGVGQCCQCRHDTPGFSESTGSYNQWRQVSTPMGGKVYQWDLPASDRHFCSCPPLHYAGSSTPLSTLYPVGSPPVSSDDGSVTSTPVQLQAPLGYQYMSHGHGMW